MHTHRDVGGLVLRLTVVPLQISVPSKASARSTSRQQQTDPGKVKLGRLAYTSAGTSEEETSFSRRVEPVSKATWIGSSGIQTRVSSMLASCH